MKTKSHIAAGYKIENILEMKWITLFRRVWWAHGCWCSHSQLDRHNLHDFIHSIDIDVIRIWNDDILVVEEIATLAIFNEGLDEVWHGEIVNFTSSVVHWQGSVCSSRTKNGKLQDDRSILESEKITTQNVYANDNDLGNHQKNISRTARIRLTSHTKTVVLIGSEISIPRKRWRQITSLSNNIKMTNSIVGELYFWLDHCTMIWFGSFLWFGKYWSVKFRRCYFDWSLWMLRFRVGNWNVLEKHYETLLWNMFRMWIWKIAEPLSAPLRGDRRLIVWVGGHEKIDSNFKKVLETLLFFLVFLF